MIGLALDRLAQAQAIEVAGRCERDLGEDDREGLLLDQRQRLLAVFRAVTW